MWSGGPISAADSSGLAAYRTGATLGAGCVAWTPDGANGDKAGKAGTLFQGLGATSDSDVDGVMRALDTELGVAIDRVDALLVV